MSAFEVAIKSSRETAQVSALGLDVGKKRIGIAGCDRTGLIATGLLTLERRSFAEDMAQLQALIAERRVQLLVVGLPYTMQGELGFQAKQVQRFAQRASTALGLPVEYVDERLTSFVAEQMLIEEGRSPSRNKGLIDRKAAALILQQWLDARRRNAAPSASASSLPASSLDTSQSLTPTVPDCPPSALS